MTLIRSAALEFSATQVTLVNDTGDYSVSNPGGYGAPNAEFTDYKHYGLIRKKNVNNVDDEVLSLDSSDPDTAVEFSATRSEDGWYEGKTLDILPWSSLTSYTGGTAETGSVVSYLGVVYYCILSNSNSAPNVNPTKWTAVTDYTTIEDNVSVAVTTVGRVTAYDADKYWSGKIALNSQSGLCGLDPDDRQTARLNKIYFHIQAVLVADQLGENTSGAWNVITLRTLGAKNAE